MWTGLSMTSSNDTFTARIFREQAEEIVKGFQQGLEAGLRDAKPLTMKELEELIYGSSSEREGSGC